MVSHSLQHMSLRIHAQTSPSAEGTTPARSLLTAILALAASGVETVPAILHALMEVRATSLLVPHMECVLVFVAIRVSIAHMKPVAGTRTTSVMG